MLMPGTDLQPTKIFGNLVLFFDGREFVYQCKDVGAKK